MKSFTFVSKPLSFLFIFLFLLAFSPSLGAVEVRLKDIASVEGIRDNQISGYGIVVGLPGTGDNRNPVTMESMQNYLKKLGLDAEIKGNNSTRNIASVLITANIPTYARKGDKIDVTVASIGDAKSLEGGVLLQSPLQSAGGDIVAVASGVLSFGGKSEGRSLSRSQKKNVGLIYEGAIVERELDPNILKGDRIRIRLHYQDFTTLNTVSQKIRDEFQVETKVVSPTEIEVSAPRDQKDLYAFLADLEKLKVTPDSKAKIVINERTGTIVMGAHVAVDQVAISRQGLSLTIAGKPNPSLFRYLQPQNEDKDGSFVLPESVEVSQIVDALNKVGASTKDIIAILQALKDSGALHADLEIQ